MTLYYAALITIIAASVPAAVWLKRESDRAWATHQRRLALSRAGAAVGHLKTNLAALETAAGVAAVRLSEFAAALNFAREEDPR